jgi:O-antigen ligase
MPVWDAQPVHNVLLLTWAELGIFGVLAFVGFLSIVLFNGWKSLRQESQKENAIFFIAFLSVVPSLLLDHFLWDSHFGILFFFLLVGLSLRDKC